MSWRVEVDFEVPVGASEEDRVAAADGMLEALEDREWQRSLRRSEHLRVEDPAVDVGRAIATASATVRLPGGIVSAVMEVAVLAGLRLRARGWDSRPVGLRAERGPRPVGAEG